MATNEPVRTHRKVTIGSERNFGIVFAVFFALVALGPAMHGGSTRSWALVVSASGVGAIAGGLVTMRIRAARPLAVSCVAALPFGTQTLAFGLGLPLWALLSKSF